MTVRGLIITPHAQRERGKVIDCGVHVIVINQMRGLYEIYKSRDTSSKPEWQGFMSRLQTKRWFITVL